MSMGLLLVLGGFFSDSTVPGSQPKTRDEAMRREIRHWQGTWQLEGLEFDGVKAGADEVKGQTLFIGGNGMLRKKDDSILQLGTLQLDPLKKPKTVNAVIREGKHKGNVMLGIYEYDG